MWALSHKHEDQWAEFCIVHPSPHWATQGHLTVPSHPSRQTTSSLLPHTSQVEVSTLQSGDTARHWAWCRGGESGSGQATEGWLTPQSHSSQYVQGVWGRNFVSHFSCVRVCTCTCAHMCVLSHMCGHMCGYMCQSLRSIIMLNCFSTLSIGAGSPNQTHNASIQRVSLASFLQESHLCLFEIRITGGPPCLHVTYVSFWKSELSSHTGIASV